MKRALWSITRDAFRAIQTDPQLSKRFDHALLPQWKNNDDFLRLLMTSEKTIPLQHPSNLIEGTLADRIYALTDGYIGEISNLMKDAAVQAIQTGRECIDKNSWTSCGGQPLLIAGKSRD